MTIPPAHDPASSADAESRRRHIVDAAIVLFREDGYFEVTPTAVARRAQISESDIAAVFDSHDELVVTVVEVWNERRLAPLREVGRRHGAVAFLRRTVQANVLDPGLPRLLLITAHMASTAGHPCADRLRDDWVRYHAAVQRLLIADIDAGREPATMQPDRGAEQLLALSEGLQLQATLRPHMDLLEAFDRAVTRLRDGWTSPYSPPVWQL